MGILDSKLCYLQVHLLPRELHCELVFSGREDLGIEFDELKWSSEERFESLHDLQIILVTFNILCKDLLDGQLNLENFTVSTQDLHRCMDLHEVYFLCLLHLQFQTIVEKVLFENLTFSNVNLVKVMSMVHQDVIH